MSEPTSSSTTPNRRTLGPDAPSRIAIVGGCGGVGRVLVDACVRAGHQVAVLDLAAALASGPPPIEALAVATDASEPTSVAAAYDALNRHWGSLDHLYFLVGFSTIPPAPLRGLELAEWDRVIDGNLRAAYLNIRSALPLLDRGRGSSIVVISSALTVAPQKGYGAYVAGKLGLSGLVKSLALELAPAIRVNAVAPSAMLTAFLTGGSDDLGKRSWFNAEAAASVVPMGRLCTPEDVVGPILFLSSPAAGFVTGQTLHVSGGRVLA